MSRPKDGGPAFPFVDDVRWSRGMSLRAWLAGKAISVVRPVYSVTSNPNELDGEQLPPHSKIRAAVIAREACEVADALIAELGLVDAEIQRTAGPAPKFKVGDSVRIVSSNRDTPGVGQTGVVQNVNKYVGSLYAYLVRLEKEICRCRVFGYHEHELEAVEEGE